MEQKKISVVIPVYNSADFVRTAFDSLACQTMPAADFEIICVNDCSTDNSIEVIEQYAKKMPNIVLINLEKNTGWPMVPRNKGIETARGRYIQFLDSDDFLGEEALERLYNAAEKYQSDIIFGRYVGVNGRSVPKVMFERGNLPQADLLTDKVVYSIAPHKMTRASFLREHGIRFHPDAKTFIEDQWFVMQCYTKAKVITVLADYDYYFVVNPGNENVSRRLSTPDQYFFIPDEIVRFTNEQVHDVKRNRKIKSIYINRFLRTDSFLTYLFDFKFPAEDRREFFQRAHKFFKAHYDQEMVAMTDPQNVKLVRALEANDFAIVEGLAQQRARKRQNSKSKPKGDLMVVRNASLKIYTRPSVNASEANFITQKKKSFRGFPSSRGWIEIRQADAKGNTYGVFVRQEDVRYSLSSKVKRVAKRIKGLLKRTLKR